MPALTASVVGALAVVAAAIFWWRQRRHLPPTRKELFAARAQAASLALNSRGRHLAANAAPLLRSGRKVSATAARQLTLQAGAAAERAAVQARAAADAAAAQARVAAQQAAALSATAKTLRVMRVQPAAVASKRAKSRGPRSWRHPFRR